MFNTRWKATKNFITEEGITSATILLPKPAVRVTTEQHKLYLVILIKINEIKVNSNNENDWSG